MLVLKYQHHQFRLFLIEFPQAQMNRPRLTIVGYFSELSMIFGSFEKIVALVGAGTRCGVGKMVVAHAPDVPGVPTAAYRPDIPHR